MSYSLRYSCRRIVVSSQFEPVGMNMCMERGHRWTLRIGIICSPLVITQVDQIGRSNTLRTMATTALLGFHAPSFTSGTDLILPAEVNAKLRHILLSGAMAEGRQRKDQADFDIIQEYLDAMDTTGDIHKERHIPEVSNGNLRSRHTRG